MSSELAVMDLSFVVSDYEEEVNFHILYMTKAVQN